MSHDGEIDISSCPYEAQLLADWLANGKPELGWRGDKRLSLQIGMLVAAKHGTNPETGRFHRKGDTVAFRYEVWRHNEDGTDTKIVQRDNHHWEEIIPSLIQQDPRTPGHVPVMDALERANDLNDKHNSEDFKDHWAAATEHMWSIAQERMVGKMTHRQMPGLNPEKQD